MAASMLYRLSAAIANVEHSFTVALTRLFFPGGPGPAFSVLGDSYPLPNVSSKEDDVRSRSILAAVPRNRRTIEKRLNRRFGNKEFYFKMLWFKNNLQSCIQCGHWHEPGVLCPHCYNKIIKETLEIREEIQETLKLDPVDKEVVVLYEDDSPASDFIEGKRVVEMRKPRPAWFSRNLMQPSTQEPDNTTQDVKPLDLA